MYCEIVALEKLTAHVIELIREEGCWACPVRVCTVLDPNCGQMIMDWALQKEEEYE